MASDDYYTHLAKTQIQRLDASRAQALADLEMAKANSDYESAGMAVQQIADLEAQKQNVINLHSQYVASQQVPQQPEPTAEERFARPPERMDLRDMYDIAATSRHGVDEQAFRAGVAEVMRQRREGR